MTEESRALVFGSVAEAYDVYRPAIPEEVAHLLDVKGREVLEVASGTGQVTRVLEQLGAKVTAVEPDESMRSVLRRRSPLVRLLDGFAQELPVADESFDAVVVSSAWHWFPQPAAQLEMERVLRDNGSIYSLRSHLDDSVPWLREVLTLRYFGEEPVERDDSWKRAFSAPSEFSDSRLISLEWKWRRTVGQLVELFNTYSDNIVRSESERHEMTSRVRSRLDELFLTGEFDLPMVHNIVIAKRNPRG
jgi:SAM-dependent methyltransferase